ncbi:putative RNA recognition motif domain, nucleotide-binding alpha-beta plait domain superfamily [Helianthus annuus]|nr:putative RNA recognition motif domain, nucleotide-binding alpha-beta plait domain superfamily [Helianthus annuus]
MLIPYISMAGRERYKVDTWYDAPSRKGRRLYQGETSNQNDLPVTKFFVSNLPGGCSSSDLVAVLKGFGAIKNIYIARKYDKLGKRFGFVSFVNVRDPVELENQMKDVWIGSYKLFIVLARFVDGERLVRKGEKQWVPVRKDEESPVTGKGDRNLDSVEETVNVGKGLGVGRSFRDTLLNVDPPKKVSEIVVSADFKGGLLWDVCGAVGRVSDFKKLSKLRIWLDLVGQAKVGIRYLGGFWVMLLFESDVCMEGFVRTKEVWKVCFDSLVRWEGRLIHTERIAWLKLHGIPLS